MRLPVLMLSFAFFISCEKPSLPTKAPVLEWTTMSLKDIDDVEVSISSELEDDHLVVNLTIKNTSDHSYVFQTVPNDGCPPGCAIEGLKGGEWIGITDSMSLEKQFASFVVGANQQINCEIRFGLDQLAANSRELRLHLGEDYYPLETPSRWASEELRSEWIAMAKRKREAMIDELRVGQVESELEIESKEEAEIRRQRLRKAMEAISE